METVLSSNIKTLRKQRGMTLQALGEATDLSPGFLSQIETNQASPSLASLRRIAEALGVSLFFLVASDRGNVTVIRSSQRKKLEMPQHSVSFEVLSPEEKGSNLQVVIATLSPGQSTCDSMMPHGDAQSQEFVYVVDGTVHLEVTSETVELNKNDTASFRSALPHRYSNRGAELAVLLAVMSPPSF
ncbi:MAG: XRE family transcriptional regulator [Bacillota bacterium]